MDKKPLSTKSLLALVGCVVMLGVAGYMTFFRESGRRAPRGGTMYFIDFNTRKVFVGPEGFSPIKAPSGDGGDGEPDGYLAFIYTCGDRFEASGLTVNQIVERGGRVAYISMYTPEARAAQEELWATSFGDGDPKLNQLTTTVRRGHMVRAIDDGSPWHQADTDAAYALAVAAQRACAESGGTLERLVPKGSRAE